MTIGNGDTRARVEGLRVLDVTLAAQRHTNARAALTPEATPSRSLRVEAGMRAIEEAEQEREALRSALASCEGDLRGARAELSALQLAASQRQTLTEQYQRERDDAVIGRVRADTLIDALLTLLQKHRGPTLSEEIRAARGDDAEMD